MAGLLKNKKKSKRSSSHSRSTMAREPTNKLPPFPSSLFNCRTSSLSAISLILCLLGFVYVVSNTALRDSPIHLYSFQIINEFPHDPAAFTQGLLYGGNDTLYESTGLYGRSSVRQVHLQTGEVLALHQLDADYFGEGLTLLGERLFQVTWMERVGFIYDLHNFSKWEKFTHPMQDGWGLATDGKVIFGSDGSSTLYQIDPISFKGVGNVTVKYKAHEVFKLNELEYVNGELWANIWQSDCIARISPKDGSVLGWILLHELRKALIISGKTGIDVLNGIAWDKEKNRLFVTGKLWPKLYEIKVQLLSGPSPGNVEKICL